MNKSPWTNPPESDEPPPPRQLTRGTISVSNAGGKVILTFFREGEEVVAHIEPRKAFSLSTLLLRNGKDAAGF